MLRAVILDDEPDNIDLLKHDLAKYTSQVEVVADFTSPVQAREFLQDHLIDVLFLDISMPQMSGFDFLDSFNKINFDVIFVTAYEEYALRAFDFYAVDYLLKPTETPKLQRAIERLLHKKEADTGHQDFEVLFKNMISSIHKRDTLTVPTSDGYEIIKLEELLYLLADSNYTELRLKDKRFVVSKTLGDFEKVLSSDSFIRIHHSYIVNINEIRKYVRGDGGTVLMSNNDSLAVSRINKPKLLEKLRFQF
jgi:two-component system, LytTR family, response regulator